MKPKHDSILCLAEPEVQETKEDLAEALDVKDMFKIQKSEVVDDYAMLPQIGSSIE